MVADWQTDRKTVTIRTKTHLSFYYDVMDVTYDSGMVSIELEAKTVRLPLRNIIKIDEIAQLPLHHTY